jgi:hypothetical protein
MSAYNTDDEALLGDLCKQNGVPLTILNHF